MTARGQHHEPFGCAHRSDHVIILKLDGVRRADELGVLIRWPAGRRAPRQAQATVSSNHRNARISLSVRLPRHEARPVSVVLMHRAAAASATGSTDAAAIEIVPPLPPRLRKEPQESEVGIANTYTDSAAFNADLQRWQEEKAAREEQMKLRRKALERQREKQRDRSGRQRPTEDSERRVQQRREKQAANTDVATVRAARDQLRAARSRPIPRVTASSYNTLIELTNKLLKGGAPGVRGGEDTQEAMRVQDQLVKCWEEILQRPLQETCSFYLFAGIVGIGRSSSDSYSISGRGVTLEPDHYQCYNESCPNRGTTDYEALLPPLPPCCTAVILSDGLFADHGLHRGARYCFHHDEHEFVAQEEAEADVWPGTRVFTLHQVEVGVFEDIGSDRSRYFEVTPRTLPTEPKRDWCPSGDAGDVEYAEEHAEWETMVKSICNMMQCENDGQLRFKIQGPAWTESSFFALPCTYELWHGS